MLSLAHTLISLPFGIFLHNPFIIFAAAFVFHLLSDSLLHWNIYPDNYQRYPYGQVTLDIMTGLVLAWLILGHDTFATLPVLAAIAGGNGPDILHGLWDLLASRHKNRWFFWAKPFFNFHNKIQCETPNMTRGLISQIILIAIALTLIQF